MFTHIYFICYDTAQLALTLYALRLILTRHLHVYLPWIKILVATAALKELYYIFDTLFLINPITRLGLAYIGYMCIFIAVALAVISMGLLCRTLKVLQSTDRQDGAMASLGDPTAWPPPPGK